MKTLNLLSKSFALGLLVATGAAHAGNDFRFDDRGRDDRGGDRDRERDYNKGRVSGAGAAIAEAADRVLRFGGADDAWRAVRDVREGAYAIVTQAQTNQRFCKVREKAKDIIRNEKKARHVVDTDRRTQRDMDQIKTNLETLRDELDVAGGEWDNFCDRNGGR